MEATQKLDRDLASDAAYIDPFDDEVSIPSSKESIKTVKTFRTQFTSALDPLESVERNMNRLSILARYIRVAVPALRLHHINEQMGYLQDWRRYVEIRVNHTVDPERNRKVVSEAVRERIVSTILMRRVRFTHLRAQNRHQTPSLVPPPEDSVAVAPLTSDKVVYELPRSPLFTVAATFISTRRISKNGYYNPIPELSRTQREAESLVCPYCTQVLPPSSFRRPRKWR